MSNKNNTMTAKDLRQVSAGQRVVSAGVKFMTYAFLIVMALIVLFPFYWMIISSLKTEAEYRQTMPTFWPQQMQFYNYVDSLNPHFQ